MHIFEWPQHWFVCRALVPARFAGYHFCEARASLLYVRGNGLALCFAGGKPTRVHLAGRKPRDGIDVRHLKAKQTRQEAPPIAPPPQAAWHSLTSFPPPPNTCKQEVHERLTSSQQAGGRAGNAGGGDSRGGASAAARHSGAVVVPVLLAWGGAGAGLRGRPPHVHVPQVSEPVGLSVKAGCGMVVVAMCVLHACARRPSHQPYGYRPLTSALLYITATIAIRRRYHTTNRAKKTTFRRD